MAQKRMFYKYIIDSDSFLEMPLTTQAVYFHLNMRADDDGFVDNWKSILRIVGGKEDDIKVLISKSFVIPFETGIIVIKHWKINNYLQKDRKKQTRHIEELKQLKEQNGEYFLLENDEQSNLISFSQQKKEIPEWQKRRDEAYKNSSLPDSFSYKIRQAFNNTICPICGSVMQMNEKFKNYMPTIQHLIPISKGGVHELENIAVICYSCNASIRNDVIEEKLNNEEVKEKWETINSLNTRSTNGSTDKNSIDKNSIIYNILYIWEKNIPCDCITHKGEKCLRRSAYQIDGKNFCNQHSKPLLGEHFEYNQDIKKFKKPTVEQVEIYCKERKNDIDANKFVDYYDSIGWLVGKKPMKDWKACVRTWERKEKDVLNSKPDISTPDWFNKDIGKQQDNLQELEDIFKDFGG